MSAAALQDYHKVRHTSGLSCDERLEAAIERLRQAETTSWACATYDGGTQSLTLRAKIVCLQTDLITDILRCPC